MLAALPREDATVRVIVKSDDALSNKSIGDALTVLGHKLDISRVEPRVEDGQKQIEEARQSCKRAGQLALALEATAVSTYERALDAYRRAVPAVKDMSEAAHCALELGATLHELHRDELAQQVFRQVLFLAPKAEADPKRFIPAMVKAFERAKAGMKRPVMGSLTVSGEPVGASVFVDGQLRGRLPISFPDLPVGTHWLTVSAAGRQPLVTLQTIEPNKAARVEAFLPELGQNLQGGAMLSLLATDVALASEELQALESGARAMQSEWVILLASTPSGLSARVYGLAEKRVLPPLSAPTLAELVNQLKELMKSQTSPVSNEPAAARPVAIKARPPQKAQAPFGVAFLPFGIAQFAQGRPLAGALFLGSQLLLLGANLGGYFWGQQFRMGDGSYRNGELVAGLQIATNVAFGMLIADVVGGLIESIVYGARARPAANTASAGGDLAK